MTEPMKSEAMKTKTAGVVGGVFPQAWTPAGFPANPMNDWVGAQQAMFASTAKFVEETVAIMHKEMEAGTGILSRMAAAKSPDEVIACQRDLFELMSANYFEQMVKLGEQMQNHFARVAGMKLPAGAAMTAEKKAA